MKLKNRALNYWLATSGGYFWTPCPLCGQEFGGHEWKDGPNGEQSSIPTGEPGRGQGICPSCTAAGEGDRAWAARRLLRADVMELSDFLLARIAEDEEDAVKPCSDQHPGADVYHADGHPDRKRLAECEAKRRIVTEYEHERDTDHHWEQRDIGYEEGLEQAVRILALPFASHPDYDEDWRP